MSISRIELDKAGLETCESPQEFASLRIRWLEKDISLMEKLGNDLGIAVDQEVEVFLLIELADFSNPLIGARNILFSPGGLSGQDWLLVKVGVASTWLMVNEMYQNYQHRLSPENSTLVKGIIEDYQAFVDELLLGNELEAEKMRIKAGEMIMALSNESLLEKAGFNQKDIERNWSFVNSAQYVYEKSPRHQG